MNLEYGNELLNFLPIHSESTFVPTCTGYNETVFLEMQN